MIVKERCKGIGSLTCKKVQRRRSIGPKATGMVKTKHVLDRLTLAVIRCHIFSSQLYMVQEKVVPYGLNIRLCFPNFQISPPPPLLLMKDPQRLSTIIMNTVRNDISSQLFVLIVCKRGLCDLNFAEFCPHAVPSVLRSLLIYLSV